MKKKEEGEGEWEKENIISNRFFDFFKNNIITVNQFIINKSTKHKTEIKFSAFNQYNSAYFHSSGCWIFKFQKHTSTIKLHLIFIYFSYYAINLAARVKQIC